MPTRKTAALLRARGIIAARRCDHGFRILLTGLVLVWSLIWLCSANQLQAHEALLPAQLVAPASPIGCRQATPQKPTGLAGCVTLPTTSNEREA